MKKWTKANIARGISLIAEQFDPIRMPTNKEVIEMSGGYSLSAAIQKNGGYEYWARRLNLEQKKSETKLGIKYERIVADRLRRGGHVVEETSVKHPYDLLVDGCVKVDVKVANASKVRNYDAHSYRIHKPQQTCDFYICCENDSSNMYVIPANMCRGQKQIVMGKDSRKYSSYKNAFNLIDAAVNFFDSLVVPF